MGADGGLRLGDYHDTVFNRRTGDLRTNRTGGRSNSSIGHVGAAVGRRMNGKRAHLTALAALAAASGLADRFSFCCANSGTDLGSKDRD
jgi:hypothetical protein